MIHKNLFYKMFFGRWAAAAAPVPGYAVLLPVPSDLPVFLAIALDVTARQAGRNRVETLVVPDHPTAAFRALFERVSAGWPGGAVRLVEHGRFARALTRRINNPGLKHWLQVVAGVNACGASHILLHDADLFLADEAFMDTHYEFCSQKGAVCLGADDVWDKWYGQQGIKHLVATWEALVEVSWVRSFKPWQHRGHDDVLRGKAHMFDTLLLAQCLTDPARVAKRDCLDGFVHFNYVISTYRWFQRSSGTFEDQHFRLLLIRLLTDAYGATETPGELPAIGELAAGIRDGNARVTYLTDHTASHYREFRTKMSRLLTSLAIGAERSAHISGLLAPFDKAFTGFATEETTTCARS